MRDDSLSGLTLVVPARYDLEREAVMAAWTDRGGNVSRLDRFWEPPVLERESIRLYGDPTFCLILAEKFALTLVSPPDDFLFQIDSIWLGRCLQLRPLAYAVEYPFPIFIKPLIAKQFRAAVYADWGVLERETVGLSFDTPVILSEPVSFTQEVRCLALHGKIVSAAAYEGDTDIRDAAMFAQRLLDEEPLVASLPTVVIDIGWITGHGWAVVETNAIWSAGLNGNDPNPMASCLAAATFPTPPSEVIE